ncbi:hypothetical protein V1523DRAFT_416549 [Lipomyces doorenjongii]
MQAFENLFDFGHSQSQQIYAYDLTPEEHKAKFSHEAIAGAASFEAFKLFEDRQRREGKPVSHAFAKEVLMGLAGAEVDKLIETKGLDFYDRERAKRHAREQVTRCMTRTTARTIAMIPLLCLNPRDCRDTRDMVVTATSTATIKTAMTRADMAAANTAVLEVVRADLVALADTMPNTTVLKMAQDSMVGMAVLRMGMEVLRAVMIVADGKFIW